MPGPLPPDRANSGIAGERIREKTGSNFPLLASAYPPQSIGHIAACDTVQYLFFAGVIRPRLFLGNSRDLDGPQRRAPRRVTTSRGAFRGIGLPKGRAI